MPRRDEQRWQHFLESMPRDHADLVRDINNLGPDKNNFLTYVHHHKRDHTPNERFLIHAVNQVIHDDFKKYRDSLKVRSSCKKTFTPYEFEDCATKKFNREFGFELPSPDYREFLLPETRAR